MSARRVCSECGRPLVAALTWWLPADPYDDAACPADREHRRSCTPAPVEVAS